MLFKTRSSAIAEKPARRSISVDMLFYCFQGRIHAAPPPNHGWKIKTQLPRTHVCTAATINDNKTAHKNSSLAPFQTYDNTKKRSASGGGASPSWPGALPLDPAGAPPQDPHYRLALAIWPPNLYSWIRPTVVGIMQTDRLLTWGALSATATFHSAI